MITLVKKEWEITKNYIYDVALREGLIMPDLEDFEAMARHGRPAVQVTIDEDMDIAALTAKALSIAHKHIRGPLSGMILIVAYKSDQDLLIAEVSSLRDVFSRYNGKKTTITWGTLEEEGIENSRRVTVYAFDGKSRKFGKY